MTHRVFVALPVSKECGWEAERAQAELKQKNKRAHVKWVEPDKMHVTVQFLGELIEERVEQVKKTLSLVAKSHNPFKYWLDHLGAFPNKSNPNIVVIKIGEEGRSSRLLQDDIVVGLKKEGIIGNKKPWQPHITIGRNKRHDKIVGFDSIKIEKVVWEIDRVEFIESKLTSDGPEYDVLGTYKLG